MAQLVCLPVLILPILIECGKDGVFAAPVLLGCCSQSD